MKDEWMVIAGLQEHGSLPSGMRIGDVRAPMTREQAMKRANEVKDGFWWIDNDKGAFWYRPVYVHVKPWIAL